MEREAYDSMYRLEDSFWWYVGMRKLMWTLLSDIEWPHGMPKVLDAGCGTGAKPTALFLSGHPHRGRHKF